MPQYKVGDVAALFSKPKEPTTESGKKLQSLFKDFHNKNKKHPSQISEKGLNNLTQESENTQNQRISKKEKKRKFSAVSSSEPNEISHNPKEFKKIKKQKDKSINHNEKHLPVEQDFPRKKKPSKTKQNNFNKSFNSLEADETAFSNNRQAPNANFKSKNKSNDERQISSFVRKSKQQRLAATNSVIKSKDNEEMSDEGDTLFKEKGEESVMKNVKKKKKRFSNDNFVQIAQSNHSDQNDDVDSDTSFKIEVANFLRDAKKKSCGDKQKQNSQLKISAKGEPDFVKIPGLKSEDDELSRTLFVRKLPVNINKKNSQPKISAKGEPDFVKIPGLKSEDDELSRTLFVGNLPVNINRKALKTLFTSFGEIQQIRYHGFETDKAKIFSEDGAQTKNANNYAASSVPGFVVFCDRQSAVKALSLSGSLFKGRHITVDFALPVGVKKLYDDKRSIFIGNLPFDCQDESVWEAFSECGRIENVRIVRDKQNGIGKGFGYVQFSTVQSKENALAIEDLKIQERIIRIKTIDSNPSSYKKAKNPPPVKKNTFKSRAIRIRMKNKDSGSRKSVKKIMKKQKNLHDKKKTANILQKSMKF